MWENALDIPPNKLSLPSFHILSHHVPMNDTSTENLQISNDIYRYIYRSGFSTCEVCKFAGDDRRSCTATRCWKQMDHKGGNEFGEATTFDV